MSPTYAANTSVPVETSRAEIERTLQRYGAQSFAYGWDQDKALIEFAACGRRVRFVLALPNRSADEFRFVNTNQWSSKEATPAQQERLWEQACRQRWRALALVIKAKLEAVEAEISEFEDEFLAHVVLPNGTTAGQWLRPQIADAYETGQMPAMLPALGSGS